MADLDDIAEQILVLGRPSANTQVYVLDARGSVYMKPDLL